jgi:S-adenosylmethionine hydrolase
MLVHLITDYGSGDLAFAEVRQRLALHLPGTEVVATPVPAFDTLSGGFCVGQLALTQGPRDRVIYVNVAPRGDEPDARPGNEGERLVAARLGNGVLVVGPNALYTFSFVAPHAQTLHEVQVPPSGSQFRSRDVFPPLVARLAAGDDAVLGESLATDGIPPVPERTVVYIDGYGNLKTSWTAPPAPNGTRVRVTVGGAPAFATVSDGTFEVPEGELAFAPGSSGWPDPDGQQQRFYELFLRGASAAERLGGSRAGAVIDIEA